MTINAVSRSFACAPSSDGVRYSAYPTGGAIPPGGGGGGGAYLGGPALFTFDGEGEASGTVLAGSRGDRTTYSNVRAASGSQSLRCQLVQGQPPATCGGGHYFGGRWILPEYIPQGYSIWYSAKFYFPSTFPLGYVFSGSDDADAATCGKSADGYGATKWLVMSPDTGTARLYLLIAMPRRAMGPNAGVRITSEAGGGAALANTDVTVPRDEWVTLQMQAYIHSDAGQGFMRFWFNSTYLGQRNGATINGAGYKIKEWGLGDYWNGVPWTDGDPGRTDSFWMDDIIIATDYTGYGAPTTQDAGGRYYIDPTIGVGDLA